jgi:hypothetical protein
VFGDVLEDSAAGIDPAEQDAFEDCRSKTFKRLVKASDTAWNSFRKCAGAAIADGSAVDSASLKAACLPEDGTGPNDPTEKLARRLERVGEEIQRSCLASDGSPLSLPAAFPGTVCPQTEIQSFVDCRTQNLYCLFCHEAKLALDTDADCDLFDDALANDSCAEIVDPTAPEPPVEPETLEVLFLGNSYTAPLPNIVESLSASPESQVVIDTASVTPGGYTWGQHSVNAGSLNAIDLGWDYVVLQDQSLQPLSYRYTLKNSAHTLNNRILASGAQTVFFMTWPRAFHDIQTQHYYPLFYNNHGAALGAAVAPIGMAWMTARYDDPTIALYSGDDSHPSSLGTYLNACVFYVVLTGLSPVGLSEGSPAGMSESQRTAIQTLAWESYVASISTSPIHHAMSSSSIANAFREGGIDVGDSEGPFGIAGTATAFDGDDWISIPYQAELTPTSEFTVGIWVHRDDWSIAVPDQEYLVHKPEGFRLFQAGSTLYAYVQGLDGEGYAPLAATSLAPGWHHLAMTYDGTTVGLWVDGLPAAASTAGGDVDYGIDDNRFSPLTLGSWSRYPGPTLDLPFQGRMADFKLYDSLLSPAAIAALALP